MKKQTLGLFSATDESRAGIWICRLFRQNSDLKSRNKSHRYRNISLQPLRRSIHQSRTHKLKELSSFFLSGLFSLSFSLSPLPLRKEKRSFHLFKSGFDSLLSGSIYNTFLIFFRHKLSRCWLHGGGTACWLTFPSTPNLSKVLFAVSNFFASAASFHVRD